MTSSGEKAELDLWVVATERWRTGVLQNAERIRRTRLLMSAKAVDLISAETTLRILKLENEDMYGRMIARGEMEIVRLRS